MVLSSYRIEIKINYLLFFILLINIVILYFNTALILYNCNQTIELYNLSRYNIEQVA